jgi:hypothetical protein
VTVLPAIPDATTLDVVELVELGAQIVAWAESIDDAAAVRDTAARWAAICEFVRRTSREGVAEAEAVLRRLEVRIGALLGPATVGAHSSVTEGGASLSADARHDLRTLAEHADVVEQVIAASDDDSPPSRRKCLTEIARRRDAADFAEIDAITEAAAPRILAALATLPDPDDPDWIVTLRFHATHHDDVLTALPSEAELISMEETQ